ncbi:MAG: hypothetical protein JSW64_08480 [Candidatus Zixiibacteriota bacterium]|nr:MAG: hypothetical protein JSW64_08480 [candidate division Zixibacteria bacterium]
MKATYRSCPTVIILVLIYYSTVLASLIPSTNIAVVLRTEDPACPDESRMVFSAFEKEMRLKGFMGRLRIIENEDPVAESGESVVKVTIAKNRWHTRKLLSVPYFLNRYRREYIIESFVEIPEGKNGVSILRIAAITSAPAVAQYVNNDKYDPALFPNQTEQLEMKEEARKILAKKLANHLFNQLR